MLAKAILALNGGSSSLKLALFDTSDPAAPRRVLRHTVSRMGESPADYARSLDEAFVALDEYGGLAVVAAVGHRIVHGGPRYATSQVLAAEVLRELRRLVPPDHLPAELALVEAMSARAPSLLQVGCFDTAFHRTMPRTSRLLAIPRRYALEGVERYGFHGLSYTYLVEELERLAGEAAARGRVVLAHLGSGASLAAVRERHCVDTTMGFTPNSGVPMGTRSGDLDPGIILYMLRTGRLGTEALDDVLSRHSGLLGVSETSADMRDLLERQSGDLRAADAVALFCHQVRKAIGALATTLGGVETLVFAGGIGENSAAVRWQIAQGLEHLGVHLDEARNQGSAPVISVEGSACTVRVIRTDEESIIARETLRVASATA
jgi:acetate kinase